MHFGELLRAFGINLDDTKHPALAAGSTENATLVTALLVDLRERGLDVTKPTLVVIDRSKALRHAVTDLRPYDVQDANSTKQQRR